MVTPYKIHTELIILTKTSIVSISGLILQVKIMLQINVVGKYNICYEGIHVL